MIKILKQWEAKHHKKVYYGYTHYIKRFLNTITILPQQITYNDIIKYISGVRKLGASPYSLKNHLLAIKFYYNCLVEFDYITHHPCKNLVLKDKIDDSITTETLYTTKELEQFTTLQNTKTQTLTIRNLVIRQLLVYQALTVSEITKITLENIDLQQAKIHIKNSRTLPLHQKQILSLQHYINTIRPKLNTQQSSILILSKTGKKIPSENLNEILNRNANKKFTLKKIRQSVITNLLKQGNDLRKVQHFAGHKNILSTERYITTHFTELRSQLEQYHPLA